MKILCKHCNEEVQPGLFPYTTPVQAVIFKSLSDKRNPMYTIHVQAVCPKCGWYIQTMKQGPELMEELKRQVESWKKNFIEGKIK